MEPAVTDPQRDALYRAVLESPLDRAARLVYADWLEEFGGPDDLLRARLIRHQLATGESKVIQRAYKGFSGWNTVGRLPPGFTPADVRRAYRLAAPRYLVDRWGCTAVTVTGGLVVAVAAGPDALLEHQAELFGRFPVCHAAWPRHRPWNAGGYRWGWTGSDTDREDFTRRAAEQPLTNRPWADWYVPEPYFSLLRETYEPPVGNPHRRWYASEVDAVRDLSRVSVLVGRRAAGLPDLPDYFFATSQEQKKET